MTRVSSGSQSGVPRWGDPTGHLGPAVLGDGAELRFYGVAMTAAEGQHSPETGPGPVRLVLVDDHEMVIEGLKAMLAAFSDRVVVVGQAVGAERAVSVIEELDPDIVLCDVRMQGSSGLDLCRTLRERDPARKVVMLSVYDDEQYLFQALRVGASGYLLKSIASDELVRQLEFARRGETAIDPGMAARAVDTAARLQRDEFWPGARQGLTQRESEILACVVNGLSNRGIANKLVIGDETVKSHLRAIYRMLGVSDRTGAVATALREGIFQ